MIKRLKVKNFTVLPDAEFQFCRGLNVVIAENGMGKTHLLKLLYTLMRGGEENSHLSRAFLAQSLSTRLLENFRTDCLGHLVRHAPRRRKAEILLGMSDAEAPLALEFSSIAKSASVLSYFDKVGETTSIFMPTRELATLCPWFVGLYDNYHVEFEGLWRDTCSLLSAPVKKGSRTTAMDRLLMPLEKALKGTVKTDPVSGKLYLETSDGLLEMTLVAEGLRKIAMLARLIYTEAIAAGSTLFWDEPEANLNPKYIRVIAECIMELTRQGVQVFVASHSVFLLRELYLLQQSSGNIDEICWMALNGSDKPLEMESDLWQLETFTAFDVESEQTVRFLNAEDRQ